MKRPVRMPLRRTPTPNRPPQAPLRARTATADEAYDDEDYSGSDEPNMKFSHAVLVVLILHVIAVAAIFAFNSIKAQQTAEMRSAKAPATVAGKPKVADAAPAASTKAEPAKAPVADGNTYTVQAGDTPTRIATMHKVSLDSLLAENGLNSLSMIRVGQVLKIPSETAKSAPAPVKAAAPAPAVAATSKPAATPASKPAPAVETAKTPAASDDVYVVAKGDNPYSIAKKLHVSYDALVKLNGITDPTKMQIGQKLKIPAKN